MLAIDLPKTVEDQLVERAAKRGLSAVDWAREAILQRLEDQEDIETALGRLAAPGKVWTLDDLENSRDVESGAG